MSYLEAVRYLGSLVNYEKFSTYPYTEALNLKRARGFLDSIHNPQAPLRCIHVAGTKGKGSTSAFIAYILRESGFKAGLYTSPHLADFRERIRILSPGNRNQKIKADFEGMIPRLKLAGLVNRLKSAIEKYNRASIYGPLTFFEAYTALAFVYFNQEKVDFAVLETGLGGRLDATNVVKPKVCVITPISYEHTDKLGYTLKEIASEKAGIIKKGSVVISAPQAKEAMAIIRNKCKKEKAELLVVGKDIKYSGTEERFRVSTPAAEYKNLKITLHGAHQVMNAACALAAVEAMAAYGVKAGIDSITKGLYNTLWPGRCEVIAREPLIVLDGAQNAASAGVLKEAVKAKFRYRRLILMLGVSNDKDIKGIAGELYDLADTVILTKAKSLRAADPANLAGYFNKKNQYITHNVAEAKMLAKELAKKEDLILITGSLFVVGEARESGIGL